MELFPSLENIEPVFSNEKFKPIFNTIEYNLETIIDKINHIDELDVSEIKDIIRRQHSLILNYDLFLKNDKTRRKALFLFTNKRFVEIFIDIIGTISLTKEEVICINKLAYDYYIFKDKDSETSELLLLLSYRLNNQLVIRLSGIVGINNAKILAMLYQSSFKNEKNIHRVNYFIIKSNIDWTVQSIINVYCNLFPRFTDLFIYTMFEPRTSNLNSDENRRFDLIGVAILTILDSLTTEDIKIVLNNYGYLLLIEPDRLQSVRFSLKSAKERYPRIYNAIIDVETGSLKDIIIP